MNIATILLSLVLIALLGLAARFILRHGVCAVCEQKENCDKTEKRKNFPCGPSASCPSCRYYKYEKAALSVKKHYKGAEIN